MSATTGFPNHEDWLPKITFGDYQRDYRTMPPTSFIYTCPPFNGYIGDPPAGHHVVYRLEKINPTKIERPEDV
jgi:hypothetical protein